MLTISTRSNQLVLPSKISTRVGACPFPINLKQSSFKFEPLYCVFSSSFVILSSRWSRDVNTNNVDERPAVHNGEIEGKCRLNKISSSPQDVRVPVSEGGVLHVGLSRKTLLLLADPEIVGELRNVCAIPRDLRCSPDLALP